MLKNNVYYYFILNNGDSTIFSIENYKNISTAALYWRRANFYSNIELCKSKKQPLSEFNKNYFSFFNDTLNELKQDDKDTLIENIFAGLENSRDAFDEALKQISKQKIVTGNDVAMLLQDYVLIEISNDVLQPLQQIVQARESEKYIVNAHLRIPLRNGLKLGGILVFPKM